jgi:hypothetical protein
VIEYERVIIEDGGAEVAAVLLLRATTVYDHVHGCTSNFWIDLTACSGYSRDRRYYHRQCYCCVLQLRMIMYMDVHQASG